MKKSVIGLFIIGLLFVGLIIGSIGITSASQFSEPVGVVKSLWDALFGGLFESGSFNLHGSKIEISRILLMFLVVLMIYSVSDFLPFFPQDKDYLRWLFAGVIAVLSFLFVDGEDIRLILTNYEVLGVMLTSIIPLAIILAFTFKMHERNKKYANIINTPLLIGFAIYTLFKWATFEGSVLRNVYLITLVIVGLLFLFQKKIFKWVEKEKIEGEIDEFEGQVKRQDAKRKIESESLKHS